MSLFRPMPALIAAAVLMAGGAGLLRAQEAVAEAPVRPAWVSAPLHASGETRVARLVPSGPADIVVLASGLDQGFRIGMPCAVLREGEPVANLVIADTRPEKAAGLITVLAEGKTIEPGDTVRILTR